MTTPNKIRTAPQTFHEVRQVMQQLGKFLHEHESVGASAAHGGTAVTAAAVIPDKSLVLGTGGARGVEGSATLSAVGGALIGMEFFKIGGVEKNALEFLSAGATAVNWLGLSNHIAGNPPTLLARGDGTDAHVGLDYWTKGTDKSHMFKDGGGLEMLTISGVATAVNEVTITNAATGDPALITATGETDAALTLGTSGTGVITLDAPTVLGGELDVGAHAINSSSGDVAFECGGTEVMRCETVHNTMLIGLTAAEDAKFAIHVSRNGPAFARFDVASNTANDQCGFQFRKARGSPGSEANVIAADRCGGLFWLQWNGAHVNTASIRTVATAVNRCEMIFAAGTNTPYMTLESGGNVTFEVGGMSLYFSSTDYYIRHAIGAALEYGVPVGDYHRWEVAGAREMTLGADSLAFGPATPSAGSIRWVTASTLDFYGASTKRITLNVTGIGFNSATPIAPPDYTLVGAPAALRTIDYTAQTLDDLYRIVWTWIMTDCGIAAGYGLTQ